MSDLNRENDFARIEAEKEQPNFSMLLRRMPTTEKDEITHMTVSWVDEEDTIPYIGLHFDVRKIDQDGYTPHMEFEFAVDLPAKQARALAHFILFAMDISKQEPT